MTPGLSRPEDVPVLRKLWTQAFGDLDEFLDIFFSRLYRAEDAFVLRGNGEVKAMAFHLPMTVCDGARGWRAAYLYAVATEREARGRGLCTELLAYAGEVLAERGCKVLLLVPGAAGLREFYRARGFDDFSAMDRFQTEAAPWPGGAEPIDPPEYLELRERLLAGRAYVSCPVPVLAFQEQTARLQGGGLFRLYDGQNEGCACAALDEWNRALVYEMLWPGEREQGAALIAGAVGAARAAVRVPGGRRPFAMARWLIEAPALLNPYFGIALD